MVNVFNQSKEINMSPQVKIRSVTRNLVDVFHGVEGWNTWTRVQVERKKDEIILHPKKGVHLPQPVAQEVMQHVSNLK
jgi:hypothetical protein